MLNFKNVNIISTLVLVVLIYLKIQNDSSIWWIVGLVTLWLALTSIGSFHIRWNYFLSSKHKNTTIKKNAIALTFDDGPNTEFTPKVLDILKKHKAKATFFLIGKHIKKNPELVKRILTEGHVIGNHSYEHGNNNGFLSTKNILSDLKKTNELVKKITGLEVKLFRPPFGVTNPNIAKAVKIINMQSVGWSIRSLDTQAKDSEKVFQKIKNRLNKGDVILLHDTSELTLEVLVQLLPFLEEKKTNTLTIDRLFKIKAYA